MKGKKLADTFEAIENDSEASVKSRGMAKAKKKDAKIENKVVKEWHEVDGAYVRRRTRMSNGNVYSKHVCKATKENLIKLKNQGIKVTQKELVI